MKMMIMMKVMLLEGLLLFPTVVVTGLNFMGLLEKSGQDIESDAYNININVTMTGTNTHDTGGLASTSFLGTRPSTTDSGSGSRGSTNDAAPPAAPNPKWDSSETAKGGKEYWGNDEWVTMMKLAVDVDAASLIHQKKTAKIGKDLNQGTGWHWVLTSDEGADDDDLSFWPPLPTVSMMNSGTSTPSSSALASRRSAIFTTTSVGHHGPPTSTTSTSSSSGSFYRINYGDLWGVPDGKEDATQDLRFYVGNHGSASTSGSLYCSQTSFEGRLFGCNEKFLKHYKSEPRQLVSGKQAEETAMYAWTKAYKEWRKISPPRVLPEEPQLKEFDDALTLMQNLPKKKGLHLQCTSVDREDIEKEQKRIDGRKFLFEKTYLAWAFGEAARKAEEDLAAKRAAVFGGEQKNLLQRIWFGFRHVLEKMTESLVSSGTVAGGCRGFRKALIHAEKKLLGVGVSSVASFILDSDCDHLTAATAGALGGGSVPIWQGIEHLKANSLKEAWFFRFMMKQPRLCSQHQ
ncbi:unnamed protein product, partial [Amoebophrya sp. A25]|eukprot:GSA25T00004025001.1